MRSTPSDTCKKSDGEIRGRLHLGEQPREELVLCGFDVKLQMAEIQKVPQMSIHICNFLQKVFSFLRVFLHIR